MEFSSQPRFCQIKKQISQNVWLGTCDGKDVTIKRVKTAEASHEIKAGAELKGVPNVIQFLYQLPDERNPEDSFLVFEWVSGKDLFTFLEDRDFEPVPEPVVKDIARQLIGILENVHKHRIAHMDIKLENIVIDPATMKVTLIDFGLCKFAGTSSDYRCRAWCGSPDYAAPEIIVQEPFDPFRADVFSLGVTLYTLLFGQIPFNYENRVKRLVKEHKNPKIIFPKNSKVSSVGREVTKKMLKIRAGDRPSIEEIKSHEWLRVYPRTKESPQLGCTRTLLRVSSCGSQLASEFRKENLISTLTVLL
jgi:serine/threonine protein kinase